MTRGLLCLLLQLTNASSLSPQKAPSPPQVPVEQMTHSATVIGVGTVLGSAVREDPGTRMIYTDYQIKFSEVWKGAPQSPFIVAKAGGTLNGKIVEIVGQDYSLAVGESLVFFVHPSQAGDFHVVIGLKAGLYQIQEGAPQKVSRLSEGGGPKRGEESLTLPELRSRVYRILGKEPAPLSEGTSASGTSPPGPPAPAPGPSAALPAPELPPAAAAGAPQGGGESPPGGSRAVLLLILGVAALLTGSLILKTRRRGDKA